MIVDNNNRNNEVIQRDNSINLLNKIINALKNLYKQNCSIKADTTEIGRMLQAFYISEKNNKIKGCVILKDKLPWNPSAKECYLLYINNYNYDELEFITGYTRELINKKIVEHCKNNGILYIIRDNKIDFSVK